jgi:exoribonuclease-2
LRLETEPGTHSGLGLDLYTHATSPIRRYLDLVIQRQLSHFLTGKPPVYDREKLEEIRMSVEPALKNLARVRINRMRYWTLKFLRQHVGKSFPALVLDVLNTKYRIVLTDVLLVREIKRKESVSLSPGQATTVRVTKSDPWEDLLELELAHG